MKGSITISWGKHGGFYYNFGYTWRICLAFTYFPEEIDNIINQNINERT